MARLRNMCENSNSYNFRTLKRGLRKIANQVDCEAILLGELKTKLKGKVVLVGMGNPLKCDDGFGTILASSLEGRIKADIFTAGVVPENYLSKIVKAGPDTILIIDAADFAGAPGELKFFYPHEIRSLNFFSTHNMSPSLMINYLQDSTKADVIFLAVQPKYIGFGESLSPEIAVKLKEIENFFLESLKK